MYGFNLCTLYPIPFIYISSFISVPYRFDDCNFIAYSDMRKPDSSSSIFLSSKTMLNNSDDSGHPCLVPDLRGSALSFSLLKITFALSLSYVTFSC